MAYQRKLSDDEERNAAVSYLCGVSMDALEREFRVSEETIRRTIICNRSKGPEGGWNDKLVEFYRETPEHQRIQNAAHLYLVTEFNEPLPGAELVEATHEQAKNLLTNHLFNPKTESVVAYFNLEGLLDQPAPPRHELFWDVAGAETPEARANLLVALAAKPFLLQSYQKGTLRTRNAFEREYEAVTSEFAKRLYNDGLACVIDYHARFLDDEPLARTLTRAEKNAVTFFYGLDGNSQRTLQETGELLSRKGSEESTTKENVRQLLNKGLARLRLAANLPRSTLTGLDTLPAGRPWRRHKE